jgi:thioester reductase-like protein
MIEWKDRQNVPAEVTPDPSVAGNFAYGQAKWISERILDKAAQLGIFQATSIRIGQLSGAPNGMWNAHEWFPSICQLAKSVGSLPDTDMVSKLSLIAISFNQLTSIFSKEVAWLPSDIAASFVLDVKDCSVPYLNLSHPTPFSLRHIFTSMAKLLNLPLVPFADWIKLVSSSSNDLHLKTRSTMLLQFFGDMKELPTEPKLDLEVSLAKSPVLRTAQASEISNEDVEKWLKCWKLL